MSRLVSGLYALTHLDLSFNALRDLKGLQALTNLTELYLVNNKIPGEGGKRS
jgi:Leucine-rich repeat (LRR) protein